MFVIPWPAVHNKRLLHGVLPFPKTICIIIVINCMFSKTIDINIAKEYDYDKRHDAIDNKLLFIIYARRGLILTR